MAVTAIHHPPIGELEAVTDLILSAITVGDLPTARIVCTSETEPCKTKETPDEGSDSGIELCKYTCLLCQQDHRNKLCFI